MPGVKVDLSGVETRQFDALPQGRYLAEVSDLIYSEKSKRGGKPKFQFTFGLQKGLGDVAQVDVENRKLFYEVSMQPQSLWNLKRTLIALGDKEEDVEGEIEVERDDYVGRECVLVVGVEPYEGVDRNRVRRVEPIAA